MHRRLGKEDGREVVESPWQTFAEAKAAYDNPQIDEHRDLRNPLGPFQDAGFVLNRIP